MDILMFNYRDHFARKLISRGTRGRPNDWLSSRLSRHLLISARYGQSSYSRAAGQYAKRLDPRLSDRPDSGLSDPDAEERVMARCDSSLIEYRGTLAINWR